MRLLSYTEMALQKVDGLLNRLYKYKSYTE